MKDLKIKVNNESESKEVQELLFELGAKWGHCGRDLANLDAKYFHNNCMEITCTDDYEIFCEWDSKETTLAELRAMVEPKMKEYLMPNRNYEYILTDAREALEPHAKDWISIPEGANYAYKDEPNVHFTKLEMGYRDLALIWQRPTQPEALPFIDDNPQSLNDQYAQIEEVRQAIKVKSGNDSDHMADAMSYGLMGGIEATLAGRQSTYGSFEDVAFVTENIMSVLGRVRVNGLSELPNTHRMALYMIASKMARIVNGDFNHFDSWHDIGGYAKLIEDLVKENNNG